MRSAPATGSDAVRELGLERWLDSPHAGAISELYCRGRTIRIESDFDASIGLLKNTFYPSGAFGVQEGRHSSTPNLVVYDRLIGKDELIWLASKICVLAENKATYDALPEFPRIKYSLGQIEVFSDIAPNSTPENVACLIIKHETKIFILAAPSPQRSRWLTRVVRQISNSYISEYTQTGFHASSFELEGLAYLAIGDSGAGKSTFAIGAARQLGARWIGNDRAHVNLVGNDLFCESYAAPLGVNKGSLYALGLDQEYLSWQTEAKKPDDTSDWAEYDGAQKLALNPFEVERLLKVSLSIGAPLGGLIFPKVRHDGAPPRLGEVDLRKVESILRRNCLYLNPEHIQEDYFHLVEHVPSADEIYCQFLSRASSMRCWEAEVSQYADTASVLELFGRSVRKNTA